jgi:hypothetical protein
VVFERRGWITSSSASIGLNLNSNLPPRQVVFRWRASEDDKRDAERAEAERLREEGAQVISITWGKPLADSKLLEHGPGAASSSRLSTSTSTRAVRRWLARCRRLRRLGSDE